MGMNDQTTINNKNHIKGTIKIRIALIDSREIITLQKFDC